MISDYARGYMEGCRQGAAREREERLLLVVRPRPNWMPDRLHRWLLATLLWLEVRR